MSGEEARLLRRLLLAALLSAPLLACGWLGLSPYTALLLALLVQLYGGRHFHEGLLRGLRAGGRPDADALVCLSSWAAFLLCACAVLFPLWLPPAARRPQWGAPCGLIVLATLGRYLEERARGKARRERARLLRLLPGSALLLEGRPALVPLSEVSAPAQGSALARLAQAAREDWDEEPRESPADRAAAWSLPAAALLGVLSALAWSLYGPEPRACLALTALASVFAVACPCALCLAAPLAFSAGIARAAESGISIRSPGAPERLRLDGRGAFAGGGSLAGLAADVSVAGRQAECLEAASRWSRRVRRTVRQNLAWAFACNAALIPAAAGALYPNLGLEPGPRWTAAAAALGVAGVALNCLRLRRARSLEAT
ncbi:MAG: hypothetical protein KGO96_09210 [Elusimicrobia bacterium]|nr:hypothetical protein [Elusimicrobiota bacterium]MDE2236425.1 hypothetical protein [Elusimicrobiota bacterium]MDE2426067.1 hypothetical protein [Elusimicrobiota bacterium]